jgi:hypothetical protein
MKKFLAPGLIAIAALAVLATSFVYVQAHNNQNPPFFETLTEEQQNVLIEKKEEMKDLKEELKDLSPEERHERVQELKQEWEEWAEDNGINFGLMREVGKGHEKGFRGFGPKNCPPTE